MQCIKCGRDAEDNHVFCKQCLSSMEKAPVKPGTPVVIPKRPQKAHSSVQKKEKPEEQIPRLRKIIRVLSWVCAGLVLALTVSIGLIVWHFSATEHGGPAIGQNYSTEAPDDAPLSR